MALRTLRGVALNGDCSSARVTAAVALLDRGWGKPAQAVTVGGEASIRVVIRHILEGRDGEAIDAEPAKLIEGTAEVASAVLTEDDAAAQGLSRSGLDASPPSSPPCDETNDG